MTVSARRRMLAAALACLLAPTLAADDWPHLGSDGARTRASTETFAGEVVPVRTLPLTGVPIRTGPAVGDGIVVVGADDGVVRAFSEATGAPLWERSLGTPIRSSPAIDRGRIFVATDTGTVAALDASTGAILWQDAVRAHQLSSPLPSGDVIYQGSGFPRREVLARDAGSGSVLFRAPIGQHSSSSPAVVAGTLYVGASDGTLNAFDAANGDVRWTFPTTGAVHQSSPVVSGNSVYFLPGEGDLKLYRVDVDSARWATDNWSVPFIDPFPFVGNVVGVRQATSSPALVGDRVVVVIRFDYNRDEDFDGMAETFTMNEYVIAVDPASRAVAWQTANGTGTVTQATLVPGQAVAPSPAGEAGGGAIAVGSTLVAAMRILSTATGATFATLPQDAPMLGSPTAANGRLYAATEAGTLYVYRLSGNAAPAPPVSGFDPTGNANLSTNDPTLLWNDAADPEDAAETLRYRVRVDDDGEILRDWDREVVTDAGVASAALAGLANDVPYTWAVRTQDPLGALSEWSARQVFWINRNTVPPAPPGPLTAIAGEGVVDLTWTRSPSRDVRGYLLSIMPAGGAFGPATDLGDVTAHRVTGLMTDGTTYIFRIVAQDLDGFTSTPVEASATPQIAIAINGVSYTTLADAVAAALQGETIELGIGTFPAGGELAPREGVAIVGRNPHDTRIDGGGALLLLHLIGNRPGASPGFLVADLALFGADTAVLAERADAVLRNVLVRDTTTAVKVAGGSRVEMANLTLVDNEIGIELETGSEGTLRNALVQENRQVGVRVPAGGALAASYNDVVGNPLGDYVGMAAPATDIQAATAFLDRAAKDYREPARAVVVDRGDPADDVPREPQPNGGRINIGAFGNTLYAASSGHDLTIVTDALPDGRVGGWYSAVLTATGGAGGYTWSLTVGRLPADLTLVAMSGSIGGTPADGSAGRFLVKIEVKDAAGNTHQKAFAIQVDGMEPTGMDPTKKVKKKGGSCFVGAVAGPAGPGVGLLLLGLFALLLVRPRRHG